MVVKFQGELRTLKETVSKDNKVYYKLGIESLDEELNMIACSADVANQVKDGFVKKGQQCDFSADYNPQYGSLSIKVVKPTTTK